MNRSKAEELVDLIHELMTEVVDDYLANPDDSCAGSGVFLMRQKLTDMLVLEV